MYAVELTFTVKGEAHPPSVEVLLAAMSKVRFRNGKVEHLYMTRSGTKLRAVAFVSASDRAEAEKLARLGGAAASIAISAITCDRRSSSRHYSRDEGDDA